VFALLGAIPGATPARLDGCGRATVAVPPGRVRVQKCEFLAGVGAIRAFPIPVPQCDADLVVGALVDSHGKFMRGAAAGAQSVRPSNPCPVFTALLPGGFAAEPRHALAPLHHVTAAGLLEHMPSFQLRTFRHRTSFGAGRRGVVVYLADLDVGALRHLAPLRVGAASAGVILTDLGILAGLHAACGACVVLTVLGAGALRHLASLRVGAASAGVILTDLGRLAGLHAACGACVVLTLLGAGAFLFTIFAIETSIAYARVLARACLPFNAFAPFVASVRLTVHLILAAYGPIPAFFALEMCASSGANQRLAIHSNLFGREPLDVEAIPEEGKLSWSCAGELNVLLCAERKQRFVFLNAHPSVRAVRLLYCRQMSGMMLVRLLQVDFTQQHFPVDFCG